MNKATKHPGKQHQHLIKHNNGCQTQHRLPHCGVVGAESLHNICGEAQAPNDRNGE